MEYRFGRGGHVPLSWSFDDIPSPPADEQTCDTPIRSSKRVRRRQSTSLDHATEQKEPDLAQAIARDNTTDKPFYSALLQAIAEEYRCPPIYITEDGPLTPHLYSVVVQWIIALNEVQIPVPSSYCMELKMHPNVPYDAVWFFNAWAIKSSDVLDRYLYEGEGIVMMWCFRFAIICLYIAQQRELGYFCSFELSHMEMITDIVNTEAQKETVLLWIVELFSADIISNLHATMLQLLLPRAPIVLPTLFNTLCVYATSDLALSHTQQLHLSYLCDVAMYDHISTFKHDLWDIALGLCMVVIGASDLIKESLYIPNFAFGFNHKWKGQPDIVQEICNINAGDYDGGNGDENNSLIFGTHR